MRWTGHLEGVRWVDLDRVSALGMKSLSIRDAGTIHELAVMLDEESRRVRLLILNSTLRLSSS